MLFTRKEVAFLKYMMERVFKGNIYNQDEAKTALGIYEKCILDEQYRLPNWLTPEMRESCASIANEINKLADDYANYGGDMASIGEFDTMKKSVSAMQSYLGDKVGRLLVFEGFAEREFKVQRNRIKEELIASGEAKSNAEADRKADVDPRLDAPTEDLFRIKEASKQMQYKYRSIDKLHDDLRQSVSTGRNSIIKEGYNS